MESGLFFVCCCLSYFLSTAGGHEVGKSWERCQAIIFISIFIIVLKKKNESCRSFFYVSSSSHRKYHVATNGTPIEMIFD
jgi:hypothetical protein